MAKTALFTNFTSEEFTGYWDGKAKRFEPGQSLYMPDYLAQHYAKHLVNRELLRTDKHGNLTYKGGDKFTSPKRPSDVPLFMELFNKAYTPQEDKEEIPEGAKGDVDSIIESTNKNKEKEKKSSEKKGEKGKAEEDEFKGKPKEPSNLI